MDKPPESTPASADPATDAASALLLRTLTWAGRSRVRQWALLIVALLVAAALFFITHGMRWLANSVGMPHTYWHLSLSRYYAYSAAATALGMLVVMGAILFGRARRRRR